MKAWMIALCLSCMLGGMAGVILSMYLWRLDEAKYATKIQDQHITLRIHRVPSQICKSKTPCQYFEDFELGEVGEPK